MKNTMKKLLCMALAIMLLVSAVPVFAMADAGDPITVNYALFDKATDSEISGTASSKSVPCAGDKLTVDEVTTYLIEQGVFTGYTYTGEVKKVKDNATEFVAGSTTTVKYYVTVPTPPTPDDEDEDEETTVEVKPIIIKVKLNDSENVIFEGQKVPSDGSASKVRNLLTYIWNKSWDDTYTFDHAWSAEKKSVGLDDYVNAGDTVSVMLKTKSNTTVTPPSETTMYDIVFLDADKDISTKVSVQKGSYVSVADIEEAADKVGTKSGYYFTGKWKAGNTGDALSADTISQLAVNKDIIYYPEWAPLTTPGTVYLHVFLNEDARHVYKTYDITSGIAKDGLLSLDDDVKTFLKQYYTAKDSDGITYEGLYFATGDFEGSYRNGEYQKVIDNVKQLQVKGAVHVNVMLKNAKLKSTSSSTADSSNPKTGDTIFAPIMVMGLTGTALAAAYVIGKKRFAR